VIDFYFYDGQKLRCVPYREVVTRTQGGRRCPARKKDWILLDRSSSRPTFRPTTKSRRKDQVSRRRIKRAQRATSRSLEQRSPAAGRQVGVVSRAPARDRSSLRTLRALGLWDSRYACRACACAWCEIYGIRDGSRSDQVDAAAFATREGAWAPRAAEIAAAITSENRAPRKGEENYSRRRNEGRERCVRARNSPTAVSISWSAAATRGVVDA